MCASTPTPEAIQRVEKAIRAYLRRTPVLETRGSDFGLGTDRLALKLELLQHAGSFKARGAFANLLTRKLPGAGVVAASGGNHGAAVAYAASRLGIPAKIFVPSISSPEKVERIRRSGADLAIVGECYADSLEASIEWAKSTGALQVHAFDQHETLAGQGTIAMELEQQVPDLTTVLVPVGGGGLIGGIAAWFDERAKRRAVRIIAVEPASAPTLDYAMRAGKPVDAPAGGIAADSLAPRRIGDLVFPILRERVAKTVLVSDEAILCAQKALWREIRIAAEPGGATAMAALLSKVYEPERGERVVAIISGGNTSAVHFDRPKPASGIAGDPATRL